MNLGNTLVDAINKSKLLQSCPICSSLDDEPLMAVANIAKEQTFEKGQFLMLEDEYSTGFFLVLSGKVRVFKSSASGKEKALLIAQKGMTFGEDALFGQGTFVETAVAISTTQVLLIPRTEFLNMLRKNPDLTFQVMESLCMWIRRLSSSVEDVVFLTARDKVVSFLVTLSRETKSFSFTLPAKKKDIADQLGLAPETLSRVLRELADQKIIRIDKRAITITDTAKLENLLDS